MEPVGSEHVIWLGADSEYAGSMSTTTEGQFELQGGVKAYTKTWTVSSMAPTCGLRVSLPRAADD